MENSETSSQNPNSPSKEKSESPATTPSNNNSTWWGGWINQAKEKVSIVTVIKDIWDDLAY